MVRHTGMMKKPLIVITFTTSAYLGNWAIWSPMLEEMWVKRVTLPTSCADFHHSAQVLAIFYLLAWPFTHPTSTATARQVSQLTAHVVAINPHDFAIMLPPLRLAGRAPHRANQRRKPRQVSGLAAPAARRRPLAVRARTRVAEHAQQRGAAARSARARVGRRAGARRGAHQLAQAGERCRAQAACGRLAALQHMHVSWVTVHMMTCAASQVAHTGRKL